MAKTSSREESLRELIRLVIGLLLGSGMAGAAVAMIQKTPDARPWGLAILVLCLVSAGLLFWWSERIVDRREQFDLRKLGKAYIRILNTTGQLLAEHLETVAAKGDMKLGEMRAYVLTKMAEDLENQA